MPSPRITRAAVYSAIIAATMLAACGDNRPQPTPTPGTHNPPNQDDCTPRPGENRSC